MPPRGHPAPSHADVALLRWWIDQGASFDQVLADTQVTPELEPAIADRLGPVDLSAPSILSVRVPQGDAKAIAALKVAESPCRTAARRFGAADGGGATSSAHARRQGPVGARATGRPDCLAQSRWHAGDRCRPDATAPEAREPVEAVPRSDGDHRPGACAAREDGAARIGERLRHRGDRCRVEAAREADPPAFRVRVADTGHATGRRGAAGRAEEGARQHRRAAAPRS